VTRRGVLGAAASGLAGAAAFAVPPALAVKDARGNQLGGLPDAPRGAVDQTPFSAVVENVRKALESVGVEAQPDAPPPLAPGPKIDRDYLIGRRKGSDRLSPCPRGRTCLSSSEEDASSAAYVAPFVYFTQKGDALGQLLSLIFDDKEFTILRSDGNFFNGQGVYVLAERRAAGGFVYDMEFNFLPNVLESIVDVRIVERESPGFGFVAASVGGEASGSGGGGGGGGGGGASEVDANAVKRAKAILTDTAKRMKWVPLDEAAKRSPDEWKRRIQADAIDPESLEITQAAEVRKSWGGVGR
jgi:uncharacterized protein (DUF1499 family)